MAEAFAKLKESFIFNFIEGARWKYITNGLLVTLKVTFSVTSRPLVMYFHLAPSMKLKIKLSLSLAKVSAMAGTSQKSGIRGRRDAPGYAFAERISRR